MQITAESPAAQQSRTSAAAAAAVAARATPAANPMRATRLAARPSQPAPSDDRVLFSRQSPILAVQTSGPRRISVGKESKYELTISNSGEVAAEDVLVFVSLPGWADLLGAEASTGATESPVSGNAERTLQWRVGDLPASGSQRLALKIVPRESRPFDLAVRWEFKPVASQAMIEVQEPRLSISMDGPRDVLYGEKKLYKLHLSNTGNGPAENVIIQLMPIGGDDNQPISQRLGTLGADEQKDVEVELTARQVGTLMIRAEVRADGGARAELAERVLVRRAGLQVDVTGPRVQYVGVAATYRLRVSNPGTASARNVTVSVNIPPGAKYLSGIENPELEITGNRLQWTLASLAPAAEQNFFIKCTLGLSGVNRFDVVSTADGDLTATTGTTTRVEAMADLRLDVKDPSGPIRVGEETIYELHICNRGTKSAEHVEVLAYFSRGIEPIAAEGVQHQIAPGQVVFSPIASVSAGGNVVLKIRARAEVAGNHVFRAEVHCKRLGTRLVSEETTHFYQDVNMPGPMASTPDAADSVSSPAGATLRAVDRRSAPAGDPAKASAALR